MSVTTMSEDEAAQLMREIAELAPRKVHHLGKNMVDRTSPLAVPAAQQVLRHLRKCPDAPAAPSRPAAVILYPSGDKSGVIDSAAIQAAVDSSPQQPARPAQQQQGKIPPPLRSFGLLPEGYYATPRPNSDVIDYWLTEYGKGEWDNCTFVRRVLGGQSSDARKLKTVKLPNMQQRLALQAITEFGIEESQNLFADTLERCIDCSTPLTDPVSRAERRGKWCRDKAR